MGKGYWTSIFNLFSEQRNHRTIGTQDVTKTCGYKLRLFLLLHTTNVHFGNPFTSPLRWWGLPPYLLI